ncbi:serine/threonine protein kinase, CMGC, CDC2/CDK sub, partial [Nowakowskiella sp. JEL0078]
MVTAANILIDAKGYLKLADFGLSRPYHPDDPQHSYTKLVVTRWYRPPELLLGESHYTTAVDMWGIGCVFGEILTRRPILEGTNDIDQLRLIFELCGAPNQSNWPNFDKLPNFELLKQPELATTVTSNNNRRRTLTVFHQFQHLQGVLPLLDSLLMLDPAKRITADQALAHECFFKNPLPARDGEAVL